MSKSLTRFMKSAGVCFALLFVLSFTPLSFVPIVVVMLFSIASLGWEGIMFALLAAGAPLGGYLFLLLFSPSSKWIDEAASLTGFWIGSISGSLADVKVVEAL